MSPWSDCHISYTYGGSTPYHVPLWKIEAWLTLIRSSLLCKQGNKTTLSSLCLSRETLRAEQTFVVWLLTEKFPSASHGGDKRDWQCPSVTSVFRWGKSGVCVFGCGWHDLMLIREWCSSAIVLQRQVVHSSEIKLSFSVFWEVCWLKQPFLFETKIYIIYLHLTQHNLLVIWIITQGEQKRKEEKKKKIIRVI